MSSKVILGVILGVLMGASSQAKYVSDRNPGLSVVPDIRSWFELNAAITPIIAIIWVISTFIKYPITFGFMAIGEVFIGALIALVFPHGIKLGITNLSIIVSVISLFVF